MFDKKYDSKSFFLKTIGFNAQAAHLEKYLK